LLTLYAQFRKDKENKSSSYISSTSHHGGFYPLSNETAVRAKRNPDDAILEEIQMDSMEKPQPVRIRTDVVGQSLDDTGGSTQSLLKT
jgi:hypothetical protein